jgi:hypothetical protein
MDNNFYQDWVRYATWSIEEAALLLSGHNPKTTTPDLTQQIEKSPSPFFRDYSKSKEIWEILQRAVTGGLLDYYPTPEDKTTYLLRPADVIIYAMDNKISVPKELQTLSSEIDIDTLPDPSSGVYKTIAVLALLYAGKIDRGFMKNDSLNISTISTAVEQEVQHLIEEGKTQDSNGLSNSAIRDRISIGIKELSK